MQRAEKRITITFQPDEDVLKLLKKANKNGSRVANKHGLRTRLINEGLRTQLPILIGKLEAA